MIVLSVRKWSMQDEKTGQNRSGVSVHYFDPADYEETVDLKGCEPRKISGDISLFNSFTQLPAKYEFQTKLKKIGGGRTGAYLTGVKLISKEAVS